MNRRGFMSGILAAGAAPAIVRADSLIADRYGRRERARDDAAAEWARAA